MGNTEGQEQQNQSDDPFVTHGQPKEEPNAFSTFVSNIFKPDEQAQQQSQQQQPTQTQSNPNLPKADYSGWGNNVRVNQPKPEEKGWLTLKVVKGFGFSKKDNTRIEIGLSDAKTNAWTNANEVKSSNQYKANDSPLLNFDYVGHYDRSQCVKIIIYGTEKALVGKKDKEYIVGTCKLDYQFFRAWFLQGKLATEKKVNLVGATDKEFKGVRQISIVIKYEGPSLAADKEGFGFGGSNNNLSGGQGITTRDIGREFDQFVQETSKMLDEEINDATAELNPFGGPAGKAKAARMGSGF